MFQPIPAVICIGIMKDRNTIAIDRREMKMRTMTWLRDLRATFGLIVVLGLLYSDVSWSQPPGRGDRGGDRSRGQRDDPTNLLSAYRNPETAEKLNLSKDQVNQLDEIRRSSFQRFRGVSPDEFEKVRKENDETAAKVLNPEQKANWQKIKDTAQSSVAPAATPSSPPGGVVRTENVPQPVRGSIPDEKPPEGAKAVVSFGPLAAKLAEEKNQADEVSQDPDSKYDPDSKKAEAINVQDEEAVLSFEFR